MKIEVILTSILIGLVACDNNRAPSFTWIEDIYSIDGVPLLSINFHDGKPDDVAVLKQFNPIPKQANELEENIDKCIFNGFLRDEPKVYVTLTGGCPFDNKFDVMFRSERTSKFMFQVREGQTKALPSAFKSNLVHDKALKPPTASVNPNKNHPAAFEYNLDVDLNVDETFAAKFGDDSYNTIRRVATHAANLYTWPSLGTTVIWTIKNVFTIPYGIEANEEWLTLLSKFNEAEVNTNVYMAYQNDEPGQVGLAWLGSACGATEFRTAIAEYYIDDMTSAEILAHEVGHNLGMNHDYDGEPGTDRFDSQGQTCTNVGGVMDNYLDEVYQWTRCSLEDLSLSDNMCLEP